MNTNLRTIIFLIIGISIFEAIAQFAIKKGSNDKNNHCILIGGFLYFIVSLKDNKSLGFIIF